MIKCILVEDEKLAQHVIQSHLQHAKHFELTAFCNNALEAKAVLSQQVIDLIFLDIQLPGMTGLHFLKELQNPPLVILTTAYAEYALESYDFNVVDYLLKPISLERFLKSTNKILKRYFTDDKKENTATANHIYIKSSGKFLKVDFAEIIYIEAMKDYVKICTANEKIVTLQTMSDMEKLLPAQQFIRVHKSYIVSVACIKSIYGSNIETSKTTIPIGINYKEKVMLLTAKKFS